MSDSENKLDVSAHPGAILRAAREELPLSVEQVATSLHLRSTVVLSMERDRYEEFDSDVFLKGYFRSYCRLVGLHEERMVALLDTQLAKLEEARAREKEIAAKIERLRKRKKSVQQAILVAVLLVFGGASIYFLLKPETIDVVPLAEEKNPPAISAGGTGFSELGSSALLQPEQAKALQDEEPESESDAPPSSGRAEAEREDELEAEAASTSVDVAIVDSQVRDGMTFEPQTGIDELQTELESARNGKTLTEALSSSVAAADGPAETNEASESALIITFSGDCWLQVVNGSERTPIARLQRAGDRVVYDGPRPYRVVLGDASVAEVSYLGKPYNLRSATRRNGRAEFVLD